MLVQRAGCAHRNGALARSYRKRSDTLPPLLASECDPGQRKALLQALRERGADLSATDPLGNNVESLARGEIRTR